MDRFIWELSTRDPKTGKVTCAHNREVTPPAKDGDPWRHRDDLTQCTGTGN